MIGMTFAVIISFEWVYLKSELNAPSQLFGVSGIFQVALELPYFFHGDKVGKVFVFLMTLGLAWFLLVVLTCHCSMTDSKVFGIQESHIDCSWGAHT